LGNKRKTNRSGEKFLFIISLWLLCVTLAAGQYAGLVYADDDAIDATVTVTSTSEESYGVGVVASSRVLLSRRALGEPDSRGALMFAKGWVSIELEGTVTDCSQVSIWLAKRGKGSPRFKVYTSSDGSSWTYIGGGKCTSQRYSRYDLGGDFGDVQYIKVKCNQSWRWSAISLDAVYAKGGDAKRKSK